MEKSRSAATCKERFLRSASSFLLAPVEMTELGELVCGARARIYSLIARVAIKVGIFSSCSRPSPLVSS